jgi:hypothetical protein
LVTVALKVAGTPPKIALGCAVICTLIAGTIVTDAEPLFVASAIEVAVTGIGLVVGLAEGGATKNVWNGAIVLVAGEQ